jgi:hypothetical protein
MRISQSTSLYSPLQPRHLVSCPFSSIISKSLRHIQQNSCLQSGAEQVIFPLRTRTSMLTSIYLEDSCLASWTGFGLGRNKCKRRSKVRCKRRRCILITRLSVMPRRIMNKARLGIARTQVIVWQRVSSWICPLSQPGDLHQRKSKIRIGEVLWIREAADFRMIQRDPTDLTPSLNIVRVDHIQLTRQIAYT